jgi:small subunit ribosomal protein S24e
MAITIRARRLRINKLLARKEVLLDVFHEGKPNVSQADLKEMISGKFGADPKNVVLFGFRTAFGGHRSTGFCLIYDNQSYLVKYEPTHRLRRLEIIPKRNPKRKPEKELKRKLKKTRGGEKRKVLATRKTESRADIKNAKEEYLKKIIAA